MTTIEIVDDPNRFEQLRGEWNELLQSSVADCLFLTWEWLYTWWKHLADDRRLFIVVVRSDATLIAIAPLALTVPRGAGFLALPSLEFLGTGVVGSDYLDIIVRAGAERETLDALATCLAGERAVLRLSQCRQGASAAEGLARVLGSSGWGECRQTTDACPFIRLAGHSWESYLASLGSAHRYNFQRRFRNATKMFEVRFEQARSAAACRDALARLFTLHELRWNTRGGSDAFHTPAVRQFHEELSQVALERDWLRLFVLSLDGEPAAALYGFRYRHVFYFYQSGLEPRYQKHSVGLVAMGLAIKTAIDEGAQEYDLLHGQEAYKFHWTKDVRELDRLELYPPDLLAHAMKQVETMGRAAKKGARRILPKTVVDRIAEMRRRGVGNVLYGPWAH
jgi:CelD/BcsL family acetyltransferase involved in cellulose biosynthesis